MVGLTLDETPGFFSVLANYSLCKCNIFLIANKLTTSVYPITLIVKADSQEDALFPLLLL